jgi:hypothetical protein
MCRVYPNTSIDLEREIGVLTRQVSSGVRMRRQCSFDVRQSLPTVTAFCIKRGMYVQEKFQCE